MPTEQTSAFCYNCRSQKLFTKQTPNHLIHLLATLFLCGLWLPVWILIAITSNTPYRCSWCGMPVNYQPQNQLKQPRQVINNTAEIKKNTGIISIFDD